MCGLHNMCEFHNMRVLHKVWSPIKVNIRAPYQLSRVDACQPPNPEILLEILIRTLVSRSSKFNKVFVSIKKVQFSF